METSFGIILAFLLYLIVMVFIGYKGFKKVKTTDDYIIGSRSLSPIVAALSAEASDMSAWLFMGLPGSIYLFGTGKAWIAIGLIIGTILNWTLISKRLRQRSIDAKNSTTLPSFFSESTFSKTEKSKNALKIITSLVIVIFFSIYTASGFVAGGKFFSFALNIDYIPSLFITALVIILYTFLGGFLSIAWNSVIQGMLMLLSVLIVPLSAMLILGGITQSFSTQAVQEASGNQDIISNILEIISNLGWALGYFGMPHILIKYMAIEDRTKIKRSATYAISWCFTSLFAAVVIGIVGRSFLGNASLGEKDSENLFGKLIEKIFVENDNFLLPLLGGFFLCAILSAIMSTAAAQLLMTSSSITVDLYKNTYKPNASDSSILKYSRIVVLLVATLGFSIALNPNNSVMNLVSYAWAGFGATFGPLVILILFWNKVSSKGAIFGISTGLLIVIVWDFIPYFSSLYSLVPAFGVSILTNYLISKHDLKQAFS